MSPTVNWATTSRRTCAVQIGAWPTQVPSAGSHFDCRLRICRVVSRMKDDVIHSTFRRGFLYRVANSREPGTWHAHDGKRVLHAVVSIDSWNASPDTQAVNGLPRRTREGADLRGLAMPSFLCGITSPANEGGASLFAEYDCWQILRIPKNQAPSSPGLRIGRNFKNVESMIRSCMSAAPSGPLLRQLASAPAPAYGMTAPRGTVVEYADRFGIRRHLLVLSNDRVQTHRKLVIGILVREWMPGEDEPILRLRNGAGETSNVVARPGTVRSLDLYRKCSEFTTFGQIRLTPGETDRIAEHVFRHLGIFETCP